MSIDPLIESLGMPAAELKLYLFAEIEEFLDATDSEHQDEEFGDVLFALTSMAWAHTGRHLPLDRHTIERKLRQRLRTHAAVTRHPRRYHDDRIPTLEIGVLHFVGGRFGGQWQKFDALQNGTVAEVALLTDAPFRSPRELTNHCIVTFGENAAIEYDILEASESQGGGNTIRCRIPDFLFAEAKRRLAFAESANYLGLQVLAALDGLRVVPGAVAHFHSWENGFLTESPEFREWVADLQTIFSPYLTVARLQSLISAEGGGGWTMTTEELALGATYEQRLSAICERVVLESEKDRQFYSRLVPADRLEVRSFARERTAAFSTEPGGSGTLRFLAGGRPVREKGFIELCREFARLREWSSEHDVEISLSILCREQRRDKGAEYIAAVERTIAEYDLDDIVQVEAKVPMEQLRRLIAGASAVIVPSLFDPFCLLPTYAIEERRPAFVSVHAGVAECIRSPEFVFDPRQPGDLLRAIDAWYGNRPQFLFDAAFPSYEGMYTGDSGS